MGKAKAKNESFADFLNELKSNAEVDPKPVAKIEERRYFLIVCE